MDNPDLGQLPVYGFAPDLGGLIGLLITIVLPLLVAVLAKQSWSAGAKGMLLLAFAAIKSLLEAWLMAVNKGVAFDVVPIVYTTIITFMIAVAVHFGLLRNSALQRRAADSGNVDGPGTAYPGHADPSGQPPTRDLPG